MTISYEDGPVEPIPTGTFGHSVAEAFELLTRPSWQADALCHEYPSLSWFETGRSEVAAAKAVCTRCIVRTECLRYALDNNLVGIWGGLTLAERRRPSAAVA
jgi:WhiB family transcriptional regulator, redox-sensing transcriptional regulator